MLGIGRGDGRFGRRGGVHVGHIGHRTRSEIGSLVRAMERFGFVGLPNAGKSSLYRARRRRRPRNALRLRHDRPQCRCRKVPDHRLDALVRCRRASRRFTLPCSSPTSVGSSRARVRVKDSATPSSATLRGRCDRVCPSGFGDDDVPGPQDPLEHLRVVESNWHSPIASAEKNPRQDPAHAQGRRLAEAHGRPARQGCRHVG